MRLVLEAPMKLKGPRCKNEIRHWKKGKKSAITFEVCLERKRKRKRMVIIAPTQKTKSNRKEKKEDLINVKTIFKKKKK